MSVPECNCTAWWEVVKLHFLQILTINGSDMDHFALVNLDVFADNTREVWKTVDELRVMLVATDVTGLERQCFEDYLVNLTCNTVPCLSTGYMHNTCNTVPRLSTGYIQCVAISE